MRTRHDPAYLASNVIRDDRFNADRNRRAEHQREYDKGMRDMDASYPEQLEATRGPDCINDDLAWIAFGLAAGLLVGVLGFVVKFRVWEWLA